jgi:hypothetical protein
MRSVAVVALVACTRPAPAPIEPANRPTTVAAPDHEALCCCELSPPESPKTRHESRESACRFGTPGMPEGMCVGWTGCGFPANAHRTVLDRPDLVAKVAVPVGSCCCSIDSEFRVEGAATCKQGGQCLDADWCEPDPRKLMPVSTPVGQPWIDRCVEIADHFEPWRKNPDWATEISPRKQLISDCQTKRWTLQLQDCLLGANSPLELDHCMFAN